MRRIKRYRISGGNVGTLLTSTLSLPTTPFPSLDGLSLYKKSIVIRDYAKVLFQQYGLVNWYFGYMKAKTTAGYCCWTRKEITLSKHLVEFNNVVEINDTLLHEIAHAIDFIDRGTSDHSPRWVAIALAIGCNGKRCYSKEDKTMPEGKHLYSCPNCKREVRYHKRAKVRACGQCCRKYNYGKFDAKYQFVYHGPKPVQISIPSPKVVPVHTNLASANMAATSKTDQMKALYDSGITSISEIAKTVGAHYSHVHTVIKKHKG
jgi:predicted SprT family Zn-dependent metalloprotease